MSVTTQDLTNYARFLRNASPQAFEDFYTAFVRYTNTRAMDLVHTTENLMLAQGHAQQCEKIRDALEKAKNG